VCKLRVRNQAKRLHNSIPRQRTSTFSRSQSPESRTLAPSEIELLEQKCKAATQSRPRAWHGIRDHVGVSEARNKGKTELHKPYGHTENKFFP
jgi:hypothetical protein